MRLCSGRNGGHFFAALDIQDQDIAAPDIRDIERLPICGERQIVRIGRGEGNGFDDLAGRGIDHGDRIPALIADVDRRGERSVGKQRSSQQGHDNGSYDVVSVRVWHGVLLAFPRLWCHG